MGQPGISSLEHRASLDCVQRAACGLLGGSIYGTQAGGWAGPFQLKVLSLDTFLLTRLLALFLGLILGANIGAHLLITPGLGTLQVNLALPNSSRFCPFPAVFHLW